MSCTEIKYPTERVKGSGTRFRVLPLAKGSRVVPVSQLELANEIADGDETLTLANALTRPAWAGDIWSFESGGTTYDVQLSDSVAAGEVTVPIVLRKGAVVATIPAGATAESSLTIYVAGVTDIPFSGQQITTQNQDLLSGDTQETSVTGVNYTSNVAMTMTNGCPGQKLILDSAMAVADEGDPTDNYLYREFYGEVLRPNKQKLSGAFVITSSSMTGVPGTDVTMNIPIAWQGCSFVFDHAPSSKGLVDWPTA